MAVMVQWFAGTFAELTSIRTRPPPPRALRATAGPWVWSKIPGIGLSYAPPAAQRIGRVVLQTVDEMQAHEDPVMYRLNLFKQFLVGVCPPARRASVSSPAPRICVFVPPAPCVLALPGVVDRGTAALEQAAGTGLLVVRD